MSHTQVDASPPVGGEVSSRGVVNVRLLLGCAERIHLAREGFAKAGRRARGPVEEGHTLAAIVMALPEMALTWVAVTLGHGRQALDIGIGVSTGGLWCSSRSRRGTGSLMLSAGDSAVCGARYAG